MHSLDKLLDFALLYAVLQGQTCLLLQESLDFFCIPVPYDENDFFVVVVVSSRKSCRFIKLVSFNFFSISGWDIGLDYCDVEWFTLEANRDHYVIFEIAPKYRISDSYYECHSSASKENELEQTLGDSGGQRSLAYCSPQTRRESDMT